MGLEKFKLIKKEKLTHNIFELVFELGHKVVMKPGQFITFILPKLGGRAYSILEANDNKIKLIIKRREEGRGGSKFICDLEVGNILTGVGAAGHFILRETNKNKILFGTGTGFVPLYNQVNGAIEKNLDCKLTIIFGLRYKRDIFYLNKLNELKDRNQNFDFEIYLSREKTDFTKYGYTTNFITKENIKDFEEFYICGIHSMIESSTEKLKELGINDEKIITEKY